MTQILMTRGKTQLTSNREEARNLYKNCLKKTVRLPSKSHYGLGIGRDLELIGGTYKCICTLSNANKVFKASSSQVLKSF